jgi:hypothetical protein
MKMTQKTSSVNKIQSLPFYYAFLEQKVDKILDTYSKDEIMRMVAEIQNGTAQSTVNTITETGNSNVAFTMPTNEANPGGDNSYV